MSCHEATNYSANGGLKDWKIFRDQVLEQAQSKGDLDFLTYVQGVSDKAWAHILEENFFTPQQAMERFWGFYNSDVVPYRK
jgi:hypothetical protein